MKMTKKILVLLICLSMFMLLSLTVYAADGATYLYAVVDVTEAEIGDEICMEIYVNEELAEEIIAISESFNIEARIVGRWYNNDSPGNKLTIISEFGKFIY